MALPTPKLDDRTFQQIVDEAKRRIPEYCPEWTDHNVSDPGVALIELFAWMIDMLLYRLNRVPEKSYITFMNLMGVQLDPPSAASTVLTFWLAAPASDVICIPTGTSVGTVQTASEPSVIFQTDAELVLRPPRLIAGFTSPDAHTFTDQTRTIKEGDVFPVFSDEPRVGNAFYLGLEENPSNHIIALNFDFEIAGIGVDPKQPPLVWEAWNGEVWAELEIERDETGGLNQRGQIVLYLLPRIVRSDIQGRHAFWIRCRVITAQAQQPTYTESPRIRSIGVATVGGMMSASHTRKITNEILGRSTGEPGQTFRVEHPPVLPRRPGETIQVQVGESGWESWDECPHFGNSFPSDRHVMIDSVSGEVSFGPSLREPDGGERQYGAIPGRSSLIRITYSTGGGTIGNVTAGMLRVLKSTVPYVDRVTNRAAAEGGHNAESLEHAKFRAPQMLRTSFRAVTAEDYEYLACQASKGIARAHCIQPRSESAEYPSPGVVQVYLIPDLAEAEGFIAPDQLHVPAEVLQEVEDALEERRLLTTVVELKEPEYRWTSVQVRLRARSDVNPEMLRRDVAERLYRYLNPIVGGPKGDGWPFGHSLYVSEIYTVLHGTPGIEYIEQVSLILESEDRKEAQPFIAVPPNGMIASAEHRITVI